MSSLVVEFEPLNDAQVSGAKPPTARVARNLLRLLAVDVERAARAVPVR